jgi:hypothetical protein
MEEAVDLITGWMLGAKITFPEYRREYQVVQRELERGKGMPDMVFWQLLMMNRYHVSPLRIPTIGYQEVIQGLSRDDVYSYYQMAYQPNNMVFVVVGDIDPEEMLAAVKKNLRTPSPAAFFRMTSPASRRCYRRARWWRRSPISGRPAWIFPSRPCGKTATTCTRLISSPPFSAAAKAPRWSKTSATLASSSAPSAAKIGRPPTWKAVS